MNHLLAFHIGPVQDFISTARRAQDWWMGSWLLAHLSQTVIQTARRAGAELVLPKDLVENSDRAIADTPNHFFARVTGGNATDIARQAEKAVENEWSRIHSKVKSEFFASVPNEIWTRQLGGFLEIYWAVVADDDSPGARNRAQAALDSRKRLRDFEWVEEPHLKCTLCGARQELSGKASVGEARQWWIDLVERYLGGPHLEKLRIRENGNERLCAVCIVKRAAVAAAALQRGRKEEPAVPLLKTDASFPSTSSVAAAIFKNTLIETGKAEAELAEHLQVLDALDLPAKVEADCVPKLAALKSEVSNDQRKQLIERLLSFDGDLFYAETFTLKRVRNEFPETINSLTRRTEQDIAEEQGATVADCREVFGSDFEAEIAKRVDRQIARAAASLRGIYKAADAYPSKYFAALMMDGDHMGAFFGNATEEQAGKLSARMSQFARSNAKTVVEQHFGRLVYAGGDDALALLPSETALGCARTLQEQFKAAVRDVLPTDEELPKGTARPTPSIGIAIAHHTQLLEATLLSMQQAEREAKNTYQRDALCVYVLKRSGEKVHVGMQWKAGDVDGVQVVTKLIDLLKQNALSMRFPTMFAQEAEFLPPAAIHAELKWLGKRQAGEQVDQSEQDVATWLALASRLAADIGAAELAKWTLLARFIASGGRDED